MAGDDSYDHTITDKVQAYNPQEKTWSVEVGDLSFIVSICFHFQKIVEIVYNDDNCDVR